MSKLGQYRNIERDREIIQKAKMGSCDEELAKEYELSVRTIERIRRTAGVYRKYGSYHFQGKGQP